MFDINKPPQSKIDEWSEKYVGVPYLTYKSYDTEYHLRGIAFHELEAVNREIAELAKQLKKEEPNMPDDELLIDAQEKVVLRECVLWPDTFYNDYINGDLLIGTLENVKKTILQLSALPTYEDEFAASAEEMSLPVPIDARVFFNAYASWSKLDKKNEGWKKFIHDFHGKVEGMPSPLMAFFNWGALSPAEWEEYNAFHWTKEMPNLTDVETWVKTYADNGVPLAVLGFFNTTFVFRGCKQKEIKRIDDIARDAELKGMDRQSIVELIADEMNKTFVLFPNDFVERKKKPYGIPGGIPLMITNYIEEISGWAVSDIKITNQEDLVVI